MIRTAYDAISDLGANEVFELKRVENGWSCRRAGGEGQVSKNFVFRTRNEVVDWFLSYGAPTQPEQQEIPEGFEREGVELGDGSEPSSQMTLDEAIAPTGADGNKIQEGDVWVGNASRQPFVVIGVNSETAGIEVTDGEGHFYDEIDFADAENAFRTLISRAETAPEPQEEVSEDSEWHPFESFFYCDTYEIDILCEDGVIHRGLTADDVRSWSSAGENHSPIKFAKVVRDLSEEESAPDAQEGVSEGQVAEEAETGAGDAEADDGRAKQIEAEAQQIYSRNIRGLNGQVDPIDGQEFGVPDFRTPEEQAYRDAFTSNGTAGDPDQGKPRTVSANTDEVAEREA